MTTTYFDLLPEYLLSEVISKSNSYYLMTMYPEYLSSDLERLLNEVNELREKREYDSIFGIGFEYNLFDLMEETITDVNMLNSLLYCLHNRSSKFAVMVDEFNLEDLSAYLPVAAENNDLDNVKFIIERASEDVLAAYKKDKILLESLYSTNSIPMIEYYLINDLVDIGDADLRYHIKNNELEVVKYLVERGARVNRAAIKCISQMIELIGLDYYKEMFDYLNSL